ncbi:DNA/RNA helicase domain-containing protein, partial [Streptomyces caeruleatus]
SIIFVTGTSGAGKTTLMVNIMEWYKNFVSYFYSREMYANSIRAQVNDFVKHKNAFVSDKNSCSNFDAFMVDLDKVKPKIVI